MCVELWTNYPQLSFFDIQTMSLNEYNNRIKAVLHRQNDERLMMAQGILLNRNAKQTGEPDKNGRAPFLIQSLKELYDHESQRQLINGVVPDEVIKKMNRQQKIMDDRQRAIDIEKRVRERFAREEVKHGSE